MKSKILCSIFALVTCLGIANARFYVGVDVGYLGAVSQGGGEGVHYVSLQTKTLQYLFRDINASNGVSSLRVEPFRGFNLGVNFGIENFYLDDYLGFRWGIGLGYGRLTQITQYAMGSGQEMMSSKLDSELNFLDIDLSLDMLVNFWHDDSYSVGVFGGIEGGYHYMIGGTSVMDKVLSEKFKGLQSIGISGRVGLSALVQTHHRIEFLAKLPIISAGDNKQFISAPFLARANFGVGYKYVF